MQELAKSRRFKFDGLLLHIMEVFTAVMPCAINSNMLHSHNKDEKGLQVPFGTSVLLKFSLENFPY